MAGEMGQSGYLWYLKAEGDTRARFADYLEMSMMEGELSLAAAPSGVPTNAGDTGADGSTTAVTSFIKSYDIDLEQRQRNKQGQQIGLKLAGEVFLAMRRFVPDFKTLTGNAKVSLGIKRYPQQSDTTTTLSPFTITSSTLKKDTRARGRFINVKIENDSSGEEWRFGTLRLDVQGDGRR